MKQANEYPREVFELFDKFVHGDIDRRGFIEGAGKYAISASVATSFLSSLLPDFAAAQVVSPNDERLKTETIEIQTKGYGIIKAYHARPKNIDLFQKLPVVLVVHENRGLNPHIEDITRRIAIAGFIAIAPDALTSLGGYPGTEDDARALFPKLDQNKIKQDFIDAAMFSIGLAKSNGKIGVVGFCYGGGMANYLAVKLPEIKAAVPFYGAPAPLEEVKNIKAKILVQMASNDKRINDMWPDYEKALKENNIDFQAFTYEGTEHGFNNNTTPRHNEAAANLAWQRTLALFEKELR